MLEWLKYFVYGNGQWMSRFECTSQDVWALSVNVSCVVCMSLLYAIYAGNNHSALKYVQESHFRAHLIALRNVFVACGSLHVLQSLFCWFLPIYYLISIGMAFNCWQMIKLLHSKQEVLAIQEHTAGVAAEQHIENIKLVIASQKTSSLTIQLAKIEAIVRLADLEE